MTTTVVARLDAEAVAELLDLREDYPHACREFGLAQVARCFAAFLSDEALALAERLSTDPLELLDAMRVTPFAETYPALDRFRKVVLAEPRHRRDPLEAAAAHEITAVEAERMGAPDAMTLAMQAAEAVLEGRAA